MGRRIDGSMGLWVDEMLMKVNEWISKLVSGWMNWIVDGKISEWVGGWVGRQVMGWWMSSCKNIKSACNIDAYNIYIASTVVSGYIKYEKNKNIQCLLFILYSCLFSAFKGEEYDPNIKTSTKNKNLSKSETGRRSDAHVKVALCRLWNPNNVLTFELYVARVLCY